MASWVGAERKSRSLKELDVGDLYDQLESMGAYLKELTSAFGKSASRQYGRTRDVVADTVHDAEAAMKDNLAASLIFAWPRHANWIHDPPQFEVVADRLLHQWGLSWPRLLLRQ